MSDRRAKRLGIGLGAVLLAMLHIAATLSPGAAAASPLAMASMTPDLGMLVIVGTALLGVTSLFGRFPKI